MLRLWDLNGGKSTKLFRAHTKDVLSCAFSPDNRQIVSASRDRSIRLWYATMCMRVKARRLSSGFFSLINAIYTQEHSR